MINQKKFFDSICQGLFDGNRKSTTVKGVSVIFDEWERRQLKDLRRLAYMLAITLGECGQDILLVRESLKDIDAQACAYVKRKGNKYVVAVNGHVYYGDGLV